MVMVMVMVMDLVVPILTQSEDWALYAFIATHML